MIQTFHILQKITKATQDMTNAQSIIFTHSSYYYLNIAQSRFFLKKGI
jgi:hypothetical protein